VLLDKLQSDYLVYETEQGSAHVRVSGRERLYLLWTFRNFNSLPVKSLNGRQQRLVENLYLRNSDCFLRSDPGRDAVVGTVEAFRMTLRGASTAAAKRQKTPILSPVSIKRKVKLSQAENLALIDRVACTRLGLLRPAALLCALITIFAWGYIQPLGRWQAASSRQVEQAPRTDNIQKPDIRLAVNSGPGIAPPSALAEQPGGSARTNIRSAPVPDVGRNQSRPGLAQTDPQASSVIAGTAPRLSKGHSLKSEDRITGNQPAEKAADLAATVSVRVEVPRPPSKLVYPIYPARNVRGKVALRAILRADGTVSEVRVLSGEQILAEAAVRAVRRWHYAPYYRDGQALETETNVNISFIARDAVVISFPPTISVSR
jgi:TonB family protein